jgi:peptidoglycan/LPS O-acetylase OafA/YrhL
VSQNSTPARQRLYAFDFLRGAAALAVLTRHYAWPGEILLFPRSYLAVDLFFALSGYVLAASYGRGLAGGSLSLPRFLELRAIRLYPLYALATAAGGALALVLLVKGGEPKLAAWAATAMTAFLFLPTPPALSLNPVALYPFVFPAWSLLWEAIASTLWAWTANRRWPAATAAVALAALVWLVVAGSRGEGLSGGAEWSGAVLGAARALFAFFAGVVLERLSHRFPDRPAVPGSVLALIFLVAVSVPVPEGFGIAYDLMMVVVVFPALVWLGGHGRGSPTGRAAAAWLGDISYGVYVFQAPVMLALTPLVRMVGPAGWPLGFATYAGLTVVLAHAATYWLDMPVRRWLTTRASPRRAPLAAASAAP